MIPSNMISLIKALIEKTISKKAIWGKTSRSDEFKLNLEKGAITIDRWNDGRGDEFVDFAIYNIHGDKIENFNMGKADVDFELLLELHNAAKREFYKVDETISNLIDEINNDKNIGKRLVEGDDDLPF